MHGKFLAMVLAIFLTILLAFALPLAIDRFNDSMFGQVTILDEPPLLKALRDVQAKGALICVHGWRHENFTSLTPAEAAVAVEKSIQVFKQAGLYSNKTVFVSPYNDYTYELPRPVVAAIESTGILPELPRLEVKGNESGFIEYTWDWRNMTSDSDPRFEMAYKIILQQQPTSILAHVQDWNPFTKELIADYLKVTDQANITVRVDDIEVNTPAEKVYDIASLLSYRSVGLLAYAVIPSGTWRGGDPSIFGISVNAIMRFYWYFFLVSAFLPSSFFLLWRFTSKRSKGQNPGPVSIVESTLFFPDKPRSVSIIVPAHNEEAYISRCLESVLSQDFIRDMEILVVNDGSTDKTAEIASKYRVKLIDLKANLGKAKALNVGIEIAKGDVLVFSDADSQLTSNAVTALVTRLERRPDVAAVAGDILINATNGTNCLQRCQMIEYRLEQEVNRFLQSLSGNVLVCPGPLFAARRQVIQSIMFSDQSVVEDAELTIELLKRKMKVVREPKAKVYTNVPRTLKGWVNQRKRWFYGNLQLWKMNRPWGVKNPWMILNYLGYVSCALSLILVLLLPFFLLTYDNIILALLRSLPYAVIPVTLFVVETGGFFVKERKLIGMLVPYSVIYSGMKVIMGTYVFIRYLTRRGISLKFGPRVILAK